MVGQPLVAAESASRADPEALTRDVRVLLNVPTVVEAAGLVHNEPLGRSRPARSTWVMKTVEMN